MAMNAIRHCAMVAKRYQQMHKKCKIHATTFVPPTIFGVLFASPIPSQLVWERLDNSFACM